MRCCWTIPHILTPFPLRTFVEHLRRTKPKTLTFHSLVNPRRTLSTTTQSLKYPQFESLSSHQKDQISLYVDTLLEWNQKMNLTAVTERDQIMERHVEDSLAIIPPILESYSGHCGCSYSTLNVVDVGSGQGVPGVILAIACPGWEVTLLESMKKRCGFLEHAIKATDLPNVQVVHGRAESIGQSLDFREVFDVAVARAVAELRVLAEYCLPLVRVGGLFVAAKGHNPLVENYRNGCMDSTIKIGLALRISLICLSGRSPKCRGSYSFAWCLCLTAIYSGIAQPIWTANCYRVFERLYNTKKVSSRTRDTRKVAIVTCLMINVLLISGGICIVEEQIAPDLNIIIQTTTID
ncbi:hypothetical protein Droror1_Dr00023702 [Drosera rotundifolia]